MNANTSGHKILYFEGAGLFDCEHSKANAKAGVSNLRIRTAFHDNNGRSIYLELTSYIPLAARKGKTRKKQRLMENDPNLYMTSVDFCYYDFDCNGERPQYSRKPFPYEHEAILNFINELPDVSFDDFMVLPNLGGYRVHREKKTPCPYNYGDEFDFDYALFGKRMGCWAYVHCIEESEGRKYPNFSLWVDEDNPNILHCLRHFSGYNKHYEFNCAVAPSDVTATMTETHLGKLGC